MNEPPKCRSNLRRGTPQNASESRTFGAGVRTGGPLENVRNEPRECTALVAWSGQAFAPLIDLHPKTVLLVMRHSDKRVAKGGFRPLRPPGTRLGSP